MKYLGAFFYKNSGIWGSSEFFMQFSLSVVEIEINSLVLVIHTFMQNNLLTSNIGSGVYTLSRIMLVFPTGELPIGRWQERSDTAHFEEPNNILNQGHFKTQKCIIATYYIETRSIVAFFCCVAIIRTKSQVSTHLLEFSQKQLLKIHRLCTT